MKSNTSSTELQDDKVAAIGIGSIVAGYLYPNDSVEITKAVEKFEE